MMKIWKVALSILVCLMLFAAVWQPIQAEAAANVTIYLDPQNGDDTADGLTEAAALQTYDAAYDQVKAAGGGTIVFLSDLVLTAEKRFPGTAATVPVTVTSKTGAEGIVCSNNIRFNAPTTLENITMTLSAASSSYGIYGEGKKLVIGEKVTSVGSANSEGTMYYFSLSGGKRWASCSSAELVVQSGTWRNIYVGTYGYKSGSTVAGVTGDAKLTMTGGTLTGFISPAYSTSAVIGGNVDIFLSNMQATTIYSSPVYTATVNGNVNITLGEGANITGSVFTGGLGSGSVKGNVNITLDGADTTECDKIKNGGGSDYTGSVGSANIILQSGVLATSVMSFDSVAVDVPADKTLTISGTTLEADTAKTEGTLLFAGAATLNTKAVIGKLRCRFQGEMLYNQNYVTAPAGSDVEFPAGCGIVEDNGVWACNDFDKFQGLVLSCDSGVTLNLYSGFGSDTLVEPTKTEGNTKYYANVSGKYRAIAKRTGYVTVSENIYVSDEEKTTRMEKHYSLVKRDGAWDPSYVRKLTDEALAAFPADTSLWPQFAAVFTSPVFTEGRQEHKYTTQEEMENFIAAQEKPGDNMYVYSMGVTPTSPAFNIPLVIFTATDLSGAATLEEAAALIQANGKPTVHYEGNIHGNEYASGEAALGMIAQMATEYGNALLDTMNVYIIPRLNPDGAYQNLRVIPKENQDPNRDFLNSKTYELQRLHYVYNLFHPEVMIDGHEYNVNLDLTSANHRDIMICANRAIYATPEVSAQSDAMARALFANMKANGLSYGWYHDTISGADANIGTTYSVQQGSLFILLESHGIFGGTYNMARRVAAQVTCVDAILRYVHDNADAVNKAVNDQWAKMIADGKVYGEGDKISLQTTTRDVPDMYIGDAKIVDLATGELTDTVFPAITTDLVLRDREAPTAYLVPADHERIDYILQHTEMHGISHYEIPAGASVMVQHVGGTTTEAVISEEQLTVFPNGAYVFGMDQTSARILAYLMEPDVDDVASYNATYAQAGVFTLKNGEYPVYRYVRNLNSDSKIDYAVVSAAPEGLTGTAPTAGNNGAISGLDADKLYEYRMEGSSEYIPVPAGATRIEGLAEGKYYVRFQATAGEPASQDAVISLYGSVTVYLDQANGSDDNDGYTEAAAVKTIDKAYAQLSAKMEGMPEGASGVVMFLSEYVNTAYNLTFPSHDFPVILTSKTGAEGIHYKVSGTSSTRQINIGGDTTFKKITLTVTAAGNYNYLCAAGHKLVIEEDVVTAGAQEFMLVGGKVSADVSSVDMTIKAGSFRVIYFGGYKGAVNGDVKVTMTGGTATYSAMPSYSGAINGNMTLYFANASLADLFCGNANGGNVNGNVDVTLGEGVQFTSFYAGSRDTGNITGTVTVTVDGADLTDMHLTGKAKSATATVGESVLVYKSGTLGTHSDFTRFVDKSQEEPEVQVIRGDLNNDGVVSDADALYLLRYTLFGDSRYPLNQGGDVNGDGAVSDADAMYLLRYTLFGATRYPLH